MPDEWKNKLFFGDNLTILREHVARESVDLIYLDPPFNSAANYNILFREGSGAQSAAQITAFEDTWHWGAEAEAAFRDLRDYAPEDLINLMGAMRGFLGESDMMAYLTMMAPRLVELHRVLKETGSIYLHCDPTASHYLKLLMDAVFDVHNFRNEITWKRRVGMSSAVHESNRFGTCTDILLFYAKSEKAEFNPQYNKDTPEYQNYIKERFTMVDESGRRFQATSLVNPSLRPNLIYEYKGYKPPTNGWMISKEKMEQWDKEGRLYFPPNPEGRIRRKSFADELKGMPLQNLWDDIPAINSQAQERLGYPTQKPEALLERIINASSNEGDTVLDPFCLSGETLIVTKVGLKPISDIQVGDLVLSHTGRFRKVLRRYEREYQGEVLTIFRSRSNIGLQITPNHPVLAVRAQNCPYDERRCLPRECHYHSQRRHLDCPRYRDKYLLEWIPAGELKEGDWVFYPQTRVSAPRALALTNSADLKAKRLPEQLPLSSDLMEWFGYFAAEGYVDNYSVHFANFEDAERIATLGERLFGLKATIAPRPCRSKHIRFNSRPLSLWMESLIGRGAANKHLPEWVLGVNHHCRAALLSALLRSDGSFRQDKPFDAAHSYRYGSASPTLSHQLWRLLLAHQVTGSFSVTHLNPVGRAINGKSIRVNHPSYRVDVNDVVGVNKLLKATKEAPPYTEEIVRKPYDSYPFQNGWLYSVKKIERTERNLKVYNLEVERDHSYTTATFAVHNCGCGTTVNVAERLHRRWLGIDITHLAISLIKNRLHDTFADQLAPYEVIGEPQDVHSAEALATGGLNGRYQFQWWAVGLVGGRPAQDKKKGKDSGIDGLIRFHDDHSGIPKTLVIQVKSGNVKSGDIRDLKGVMERESAPIGAFLTLKPPTRDMRTEAVAAGFYEPAERFYAGQRFPRLQILTIEELLHGAQLNYPDLHLGTATLKRAARKGKHNQSGFDF